MAIATAPAMPASANSPPARIVIGWGLVATNANAPTLPSAGRIDCQPPPPVGPASTGGAASRTESVGTGGGRRRTGRSSGIFVTPVLPTWSPHPSRRTGAGGGRNPCKYGYPVAGSHRQDGLAAGTPRVLTR